RVVADPEVKFIQRCGFEVGEQPTSRQVVGADENGSVVRAGERIDLRMECPAVDVKDVCLIGELSDHLESLSSCATFADPDDESNGPAAHPEFAHPTFQTTKTTSLRPGNCGVEPVERCVAERFQEKALEVSAVRVRL